MQQEIRYEEIASLLDDYVRQHIDPEPPLLHTVSRLTHLRLAYSRMCSGHLQGRLLKMLCKLVGAHRVLELGSFSGYSALSMAEALTPDPDTGEKSLHTIEVSDELQDFLQDVMTRAGEWARPITLHFGDALSLIAPLSQQYSGSGWDVVFMDADKRQYAEYYTAVLPYVRAGGLILADNTLWDGKVLDPHPKASDGQTLGLQRFNDMVAADPRVERVILPMRDGLTLIRVKEIL